MLKLLRAMLLVPLTSWHLLLLGMVKSSSRFVIMRPSHFGQNFFHRDGDEHIFSLRGSRQAVCLVWHTTAAECQMIEVALRDLRERKVALGADSFQAARPEHLQIAEGTEGRGFLRFGPQEGLPRGNPLGWWHGPILSSSPVYRSGKLHGPSVCHRTVQRLR